MRAGAAAARRAPPRLYAYVRVALGPAARARLEGEAARYAAIPAYAANLERMGATAMETAIAAESPDALRAALGRWDGVLDEVVLRAIPGEDTLDAHVALLRAAAPA